MGPGGPHFFCPLTTKFSYVSNVVNKSWRNSMTAILLSLFLLLSSLACADTVKAFSVPSEPSCEISVTGGYDIDEPSAIGSGRYFAYKDGCGASIVDVTSHDVAYRLDFEGLGADTKSQLSHLEFYRGLTASGEWSAVYTAMQYDESDKRYIYTIGIVDGKKLRILSTSAISNHSFNLYGNTLYIVLHESDRYDFYVLRSDIPEKSASALKKSVIQQGRRVSPVWRDYDPAGRSLDNGNTPRNVMRLVK